MKRAISMLAVALMSAAVFIVFATDASAVPSYARTYGVDCTSCHTIWGALNGNGVTFRLSGYRAMNGTDLTPINGNIKIGPDTEIPAVFPLSIISGVGYDSRTEKITTSNGVSITQRGSSIDLEDASLFLTGPIGKHLSAFIEFPMYETKEGEFLPVGRGDADGALNGPSTLQFKSESPTFEVAKFWWNNVLGDSLPRDSVNLLGGITQLPLGYASGKVRLSVNQYPIYERRALDLLVGSSIVDKAFLEDDGLFRLSEAQVLFEVNGMVVPGRSVTDVPKKDTFWYEYHLGVTNGSEDKADNNNRKDMYGRFVMRWYRQSLGFFGYYSPDTYGDNIRKEGFAAGFMNTGQFTNSSTRLGVDATLSLAAVNIPVWLENQFMTNKEKNPTGFGQAFRWAGGFHQLNWQVSKKAITYARYDWIRGKSFDDTAEGGTTKADPRETDGVAGVQYLVQENVKLVGEYRHDVFEDQALNPGTARIVSDSYTVRAMVGF